MQWALVLPLVSGWNGAGDRGELSWGWPPSWRVKATHPRAPGSCYAEPWCSCFCSSFHTDAENRSSVRPMLWVIQTTESFFKTLPRLSTGCQGDRFCRHVLGEKKIYLEWFLKALEIFGKCEQLVPHIFSLISCFFKKWLCWRERVVCIFPLPLAPFPEHWFFNTKRQNFFHRPWNAACILKIQQLSLLFARGFVSFHTLLKPPLCSEHTVPSCEERGVEGRDLREHCLFSQQT